MLFNVLLKTKSDICYALIEMEKKVKVFMMKSDADYYSLWRICKKFYFLTL